MPSALPIAAVIVAVALVGADRAAAAIVRRRVGRLIGVAWHARSAPVVRIGGPFLTQLATGVYRRVGLGLAAFSVGGMDFTDLTATLTGVRAPVRRLLAGDGLIVSEISASFAIPFAALSSRLPAGLTLRRRRQELQIHGAVLAVPVSGIVEISTDRRRVFVNPRVAGVPSLVGFRVDLPALPPEVTITSIMVTDSAVRITVAGRQVRLGAKAQSAARLAAGRSGRMRPWSAD